MLQATPVQLVFLRDVVLNTSLIYYWEYISRLKQ